MLEWFGCPRCSLTRDSGLQLRQIQLLISLEFAVLGERETARSSARNQRTVAEALAAPVEIGLGEMKGCRPDLRTNAAPGNVVSGRVDAAPNARQARLVRGVPVGCPLECHIHAGAVFKDKKLVFRRMEFTHTAGKERVSGEAKNDFDNIGITKTGGYRLVTMAEIVVNRSAEIVIPSATSDRFNIRP